TISDSVVGCEVLKLIGSTASSPSGNFIYKWFYDAGSGPESRDEDDTKDFVPFITKDDVYYYRQVMSGTCITNSNRIKVVNFNENNFIYRYVPQSYTCLQTLNGSDMTANFPNVEYQWLSSTDKQTWVEVDLGQNLSQSIVDTILRYYVRVATDSICTSTSNILENKAVGLAVEPNSHYYCGDSLFPLRIRYEFNKPYYVGNIDKVWELKKAGTSTWYSIDGLTPDDTLTTIGEMVSLIGGGTETLELGDTLRLNYLYVCGTNYSFYSEKLVIEEAPDFEILNHPEDTVIDAGHRAHFIVQVNYPEQCQFRWQFSQTGTG